MAHGLASDLFALPMAVAGVSSTAARASAGKSALSGAWVEGVSRLALPAVRAGVGLSALAAATAAIILSAALRPLPVAEAARGTHFQASAQVLDVEVWPTERS